MTPISDSTLVAQIHKARYGIDLSPTREFAKNPFFQELSRFAKSQETRELPHVSLATIRNWLRDDPPEPKDNGKRFLLFYLRHVTAAEFELNHDAKEKLRVIGQFLATALPEVEAPHRPAQAEPLDPIVAERMQHLFSASRKNPRSIAADLFRGGDPNDAKDYSYFLAYRHSTNRGEVLKTFIVLQKPDPDIFSHYGFNHFVWGGGPRHKHIFRECEGAVLKLEKSYYFLGYNFVVAADKRNDPKTYATMRPEARKHPNGMGLLSMEYADVESSPGLFGGVTVTLAAAHQPVIARVAFLHLGTKSSLGKNISDAEVMPDELKPNKVTSDLKETVRRLRENGCQTFGMRLQDTVGSRSWEKTGARAISADILKMIDNTPAWKVSGAKTRQTARGAIETFGRGRPRD